MNTPTTQASRNPHEEIVRTAAPSNAKTGQGPVGAQVNVSELVMEASCALALARVAGPIDFRAAFEHVRRARHWAYRAGAASITGAPVPLQFEGSPTLIGAWHCGQSTRLSNVYRLDCRRALG
jgi:hypothetical protein